MMSTSSAESRHYKYIKIRIKRVNGQVHELKQFIFRTAAGEQHIHPLSDDLCQFAVDFL